MIRRVALIVAVMVASWLGTSSPIEALPSTCFVPPLPTVVVNATGCTDCGACAGVGFTAHVTNGGAAIAVELKTGIRLPDGSAVTLGDYVQVLAGGSATDVVLIPPCVIPVGVPPGIYIVEAALLEPVLGINWTRSSVRVIVH